MSIISVWVFKNVVYTWLSIFLIITIFFFKFLIIIITFMLSLKEICMINVLPMFYSQGNKSLEKAVPQLVSGKVRIAVKDSLSLPYHIHTGKERWESMRKAGLVHWFISKFTLDFYSFVDIISVLADARIFHRERDIHTSMSNSMI